MPTVRGRQQHVKQSVKEHSRLRATDEREEHRERNQAGVHARLRRTAKHSSVVEGTACARYEKRQRYKGR